MTTCPVNSLRQLPPPLDIADVVSRALRLSSSGGTEVRCPRPTSEWGRLNSLTAIDGRNGLKATALGCSSYCSTFCEKVLEDNHLAEMEIDAWAEARSSTEHLLKTEPNIEQLDEFYRYFDDTDEEFQPQSVESSDDEEHIQHRKRAKQPPPKKRRSAYYEESSPET